MALTSTCMKNTAIIVLMLLLTGCATREMSSVPFEDSFSKFLDRYYADYLKLNPLEATQIGDNRFNDRLPIDISEAYREEARTFYQHYLDSLKTFERDALTEQQQISMDILEREATLALERLDFPEHLMPVQQFWGLTLTMPLIGSGKSYQPFRTVKDYEDFLSRIDTFSIWIDTAIVNMRKGLDRGYTYPRVLMERVLPQAKDMMVSDVTKSIFYQPVDAMPDSIPGPDRQRLTEAYKVAIWEKIVPAHTKLHDFIRDEYIPRTRTSSGVSDITDGEAYYSHLF